MKSLIAILLLATACEPFHVSKKVTVKVTLGDPTVPLVEVIFDIPVSCQLEYRWIGEDGKEIFPEDLICNYRILSDGK